MGTPHIVYEMIDPRDMSIFYVGITVHLYERYKQHMRLDGTNLLKDQRIQEIVEAGHLPIMRTKEKVDSLTQALLQEGYWITFYLQQGIPLLNIIGSSEVLGQKLKNPKKPHRPQSPFHIKPWILADLPVGKRGDMLVSVEYATDEEFQAWVDYNGIPVEENEVSGWNFDDRCMVINYVFAQNCTLEFADGSLLPANSESE